MYLRRIATTLMYMLQEEVGRNSFKRPRTFNNVAESRFHGAEPAEHNISPSSSKKIGI